MLNHIVMWKIKEEFTDKDKIKDEVAYNLENLIYKIEELKEIKVKKFMEATSTHDIALFVKVEDEKALVNYSKNPLHIEVVEKFIKPYIYDRVCIDFYD